MALKDASFRADTSGSAVLATNLQYYLGIVNQLFNMVPGNDPFNPGMGLDLGQYRFKSGVIGERDGEYETKITDQFSRYTDIRVSNPVMQFSDKGWDVTFQIMSDAGTYTALVGYDENTLKVLIDDRNN